MIVIYIIPRVRMITYIEYVRAYEIVLQATAK